MGLAHFWGLSPLWGTLSYFPSAYSTQDHMAPGDLLSRPFPLIGACPPAVVAEASPQMPPFFHFSHQVWTLVHPPTWLQH
jgi:hypothetical protein